MATGQAGHVPRTMQTRLPPDSHFARLVSADAHAHLSTVVSERDGFRQLAHQEHAAAIGRVNSGTTERARHPRLIKTPTGIPHDEK